MEPARMDDKTAQLTLGRRDSREDYAHDCPVCMTAFDEMVHMPRTLPCGHTFCTPCVNGLKKQGKLTCPNCRAVHAVPEAGQFPVSYTIEKLLRMLRRTSLASTPPSAKKDTAEPAHSLETRPGEKDQQGLNEKVRSLLEKQEAKILAAIHNCQKVKAQLSQYETTVKGWGRQQRILNNSLQTLVDPCMDARVLAQQEELSASDKRQQIDHGEQQLHTVLQAVRTAASAGEAYETIVDSDHVMEEETQREEECLAILPDVHTVTTIKKVIEVSHAALEAAATVQAAQQTAGVGGGAAGHASLPAAAASSIRDRVDALMSQPLKICPRGAMEPARMDDKTAQLTLGRRDSREDYVQDCPMCLTVFDEMVQRPRTLPCGHTFCTPCVNGLNVQGLVTCHNCHVMHVVPEARKFPISYTIENLIRRLRRTLLASTPPSAEKDTAEPAHSLETRPGEKGQQGLNEKVRSQLEKQEAKILAAIHNCQKVKAQLSQYETTVRGWGRQQLSLEDRLQSLVDQCKDARMLALQEELSASDKRQQVDQGEQQLHTVLQAVRKAASGVEAYKTIEDSNHVMEEETQREEECLAMFPDVHTVTTIKKATEVSQAALKAAATVQAALEATATVQAAQQTAGVGGGAAGDASLPAAAASSIRDRVDALMSPPLKVEDLRSLTQHARNLLQRGLVFAVHTMEGRSRQASLNLEDYRLYLHCLRDQPLPRCAVTLQVDEVAAAAPPCLLFLMLEWPGSAPRRVLIHLNTDTPLARQFLLLCTGQRGPCYNGTKLFEVRDEGHPGERVRGGDYEQNNGKGGVALLPDIDEGVYGKSVIAGDVGLVWRDRARAAQFSITTKDMPGAVRIVPCVFGKVVGGLEVVVAAVQHRPITEVSVVDCGAVLWE